MTLNGSTVDIAQGDNLIALGGQLSIGVFHLGLKGLQALLGGQRQGRHVGLLARDHLDGTQGGLRKLSVTSKNHTNPHELSNPLF